jgi:ssRNA-specific RNase YbeY (16S rRNA maturation enzyme)
MITVIDAARFTVERAFVISVVEKYLQKRGVSPVLDVNIVFVGKRKMLYIATVYKREPEALPVLSFPYLTDKRMMHKTEEASVAQAPAQIPALLGEVFICFPQAVLLAAERNKRVNDILTWLIEHGLDNLISK